MEGLIADHGDEDTGNGDKASYSKDGAPHKTQLPILLPIGSFEVPGPHQIPPTVIINQIYFINSYAFINLNKLDPD